MGPGVSPRSPVSGGGKIVHYDGGLNAHRYVKWVTQQVSFFLPPRLWNQTQAHSPRLRVIFLISCLPQPSAPSRVRQGEESTGKTSGVIR